jgi:nitrite reductase/ring-hydroxylating ferredoxin subunit
VIPLAALKSRTAPGWTPGPPLAEVGDSRPYRLDIRDTSIVLVRVGDDLQAFRNECAHQGLPIDGGLIDREARTITCPWHGFRFDCATGECLTAPHVQLETVPVRVEQGIVHVQIG